METIIEELNKKKPNNRENLQIFCQLVEKELSSLYEKTDCIENYSKYYEKCRQNGRQYYKCTQTSCSFATNKSSIFVRHVRRHLNERPYICFINDCKQRFDQKCELRVHSIRHFDDKPFKCQQNNCKKSYTNNKALSLHMKSHFGLRYAFVCNVSNDCKSRFVTNWLLNKHLKEKHNIVVNRSLKQSFNKSMNQSMNQSVNQSMNQSMNQSVNQTVKQMVDQLADELKQQSQNQSMDSMTQSMNQTFNHSVNQSVSYPMSASMAPFKRQWIDTKSPHFSNQLLNQSVVESVNQTPNDSSVDCESRDMFSDFVSHLSSVSPHFAIKSNKNTNNLLSKMDFKAKSMDFGYEEVIKYMINNNKQKAIDCNQRRQALVENPNSDYLNVKCVEKSESISESIGFDSNQTLNDLSNKCIECFDSMIRVESIGSNIKYLCKCGSTANTINAIVEHIFDHISRQLALRLRLRTEKVSNEWLKLNGFSHFEELFESNGTVCLKCSLNECHFRTYDRNVMSFHLYLHSKNFV